MLDADWTKEELEKLITLKSVKARKVGIPVFKVMSNSGENFEVRHNSNVYFVDNNKFTLNELIDFLQTH